MELPHIGEYCSQRDCNQLDYLPIKCTLCSKMFCNSHHKYEAHCCPERYKLDVHIPICPLCSKPVPSKPGQQPDLAVNDHLENNCQSKQHEKIFNNKCSVPKCRQKEMVSVKCDKCKLNFCLKHRHACDHDCKGEAAVRRELTLNGSIFKNWFSMPSNDASSSSSRTTSKVPSLSSKINHNITVHHATPPTRATVRSIQGGMSEEEALEKAIFESTSSRRNNDALPEVSNTSEDEDLARAIALSLEDSDQQSTRLRNKNKTAECNLS